jgi:hypothetical protein
MRLPFIPPHECTESVWQVDPKQLNLLRIYPLLPFDFVNFVKIREFAVGTKAPF